MQLSGADASLFDIGTQAITPVTAGGTATFTVAFAPDASGSKTATVSIANNDSDENPYTFSVDGTGALHPAQEIQVTESGVDIAHILGAYDFGSVAVGASSSTVTFTIKNLGSTNLTLTGSPFVKLRGQDPSVFAINTQPTSPLSPEGTTTFAMTFTPVVTALRSATVLVGNNDTGKASA